MEGHEDDELEDLNSTIYTFPPNVQNVIEQVRLITNCQNIFNCYSSLTSS